MKNILQFYRNIFTVFPGMAGRNVMVVSMLLLLGTAVNGQVDCTTTMACNDGVQVSLDDNCIAVINPDMILEDPAYNNSFFEVKVMDLNGVELPSNVMDYSHVNQEFNVSVTLIGCASSCWGTIRIEDKLPPTFDLCENYVVECADDIEPGGIIPFPTVTDACSGTPDLEYFDSVAVNTCDEFFVKTVTRTWIAEDEQGNTASCTQRIFVERARIGDVVFPPNFDDLEEDAYECDVNLELLPNGAPSPAETGYPTGIDCPNIQMYYDDIIFDLCGASRKVLRQWVVIDWCTGEERTDNQIIKILDTSPPVCTANQDFVNEIYTDEGECTGTFEVPPPTIIFECSDYSYVVGYKLRDDNGDPFEDPIYDNVTYNPLTGLYTITDLPQDTTWIVYTITDVCGHSTMCFTEVFVEDGEAPTPVCEGYTVVGIDNSGLAEVFAESIDDNSNDNCEIDRFEVRRRSTPCGIFSDLQWGESINFCCEDVGNGPVIVEFRVYDVAGNFNDCVVNVTVQDKINPTIECPPNITISCTVDYTDLSVTGNAISYDNCNALITTSDDVDLNDCGLGTVIRTFTATDNQGRTATCEQYITIRDNNPFNAGNIIWPMDESVDGCDASATSPEELNSFPILTNTDCANVNMSYDDDIFYNTPDYCIKILRHWKIADWCTFDPQNPVYYEYVQKIGITNDVPPVFEGCNDMEFISDDGDCIETVSFTVTAEDDCTPIGQIDFDYTIDLDNNGSIELTGTGRSFNENLESGTHRVTYTAEDGCGNVATCSFLILVQDNKPPTPICIGSLTWVLGEDGSTEVWAEDFNLKSEDGCDDEDELTYFFDEAGTLSAMSFDCTDIPNGIAEEIPLQMYVFDTDGNFEFCSVTLVLQDSNLSDACEDVGTKATIAGRIMSPESEGMTNIEVELMDMTTDEPEMEMTETDGAYTFDELSFYDEYVVEPIKNDDVTNGVNTLDLVLIQRHILELSIYEDPYKLIAADVNGDDNISISDLLQLRKVILGIDATFGDNTSWRFVPESYEIEDPTHPFGFDEKVVLNELYLSQMDVNFLAVKTADMNGDASMNLKGGDEASTRRAPRSLAFLNKEYAKGDHIKVPVYAHELDELIGMQMALNISGLEFKSINSGVANVTASNIYAEEDLLKLSWNTNAPIGLDADDVLFEMEFLATSNGNVASDITLTDLMSSEYYDSDLESYTLDIAVTEEGESPVVIATKTKLYQNSPNPFDNMTTIGFDLEKQGLATLVIYDVAGKEVYRITSDFDRGYNEITIDMQSLSSSSSIYYYQLKANNFIDTRKMIKVGK